MLSKSQARLFFLTATGGFSFVFLGLTVDTLRQVPERTHAAALSAAVVHGKELFDSNNCMGCHTILGEGAYYAPELTKVMERRDAEWIHLFMADPQAMFPNERKMVKYDFTCEEVDALIAFFTWVGQIDTNGFPPKPDLVPPAPPAPVAAVDPLQNAPATFKTVCVACHAVGGTGGSIGPALDGAHAKYTAETLAQWLADPQAVKPGTTMPNLNLPPATRDEIVAWLMNLAPASAPAATRSTP